MTKRRSVHTIFDCLTILVLVFGVIGSLGAWESQNINLTGLFFQLALTACTILAINVFKAYVLKLVMPKKRIYQAEKRLYQLVKTA